MSAISTKDGTKIYYPRKREPLIAGIRLSRSPRCVVTLRNRR